MNHRLLESLAARLRSKGVDVPPGDLEALLDAAISKLWASQNRATSSDCRQSITELLRIFDSQRIDRN